MRPSYSVVLVALATAFSLLGDQTLYVVLPTYYSELDLIPYQVGLILSLNRWVRLVTNQMAEWFCRRYNPTLLLILALALGAVTTAVYGMVSLFPVLLAARVLWGLSWSFIRQVGLLTVIDSSSDANIGRMMGFYLGISRIGSVVGNLGGALGHDLIGFTRTLLVFSGISLIAVPLGMFSRRKLSTVEGKSRVRRGVVLRDPGLMVCGFVVGCVGTGLVISTLGRVLVEAVGESLHLGGFVFGVTTLTGVLLSTRWIIDGLGSPMLGEFSDRIGLQRSALLFLGLGAVALLIASWVSGVLPIVLMVVSFFTCGVGASVVMVSRAGKRGSQSVASYVTASDMGAAVGPVLGWAILQAQISSGLIFVVGSGLYLLAAMVVWLTFENFYS